MLETTITNKEAGTTLEKYIRKSFPGIPAGAMYKALRSKKIKVNRKRADAKTILQEGDHILFFLPPDMLRTEQKDYSGNAHLDIVYEDADLLVVNKPRGMLSQNDGPGSDSLDTRIKNYLFQTGAWDPEKDRSFLPAVAHRLDRNTSGLILAAKNGQTARKLAKAMRDHTIRKWYKAKIDGDIPAPTDIKIKLKKEDLKAVPAQDGKEAITHVYPTDQPGLVLCELETGRFHQIRASLASIGHPLAGDKKYGSGTKGSYFLQAYKLDLSNTDLDLEQTVFEI